jgi:predicted transcriptional regulator
MSVLWRLGSATVNDVRDALDEDLAYTSVLSALQTLEEKGYVRHEPEGRAYR